MTPSASGGPLEERPLGNYRGLAYWMLEASKLGFSHGHPDWSNLGQGQPETGPLDGAPPRFMNLAFEPDDHAYGPPEGLLALRQRIAERLNRLFRAGKRSQYAAANIALAQGGRLALLRTLASLEQANLGYLVPDYSGFAALLRLNSPRLTVVPIHREAERGFRAPLDSLAGIVQQHGLNALLASNPCDPTGSAESGERLERWVGLARELRLTLILDEHQGNYVYEADGSPANGGISAAAHVEDVDKDPVLLVDGLSKSLRYPGWKLGWVAGPKAMIQAIVLHGSALGGSPARPLQRAAFEILEAKSADQECSAARAHFAKKRALMHKRLTEMGIRIAADSRATFYLWGDLSALPKPFDEAQGLFRHGLQKRVIAIPGEAFDAYGAAPEGSPYATWMRFSFAPPLDSMRMGLDRLASMLKAPPEPD